MYSFSTVRLLGAGLLLATLSACGGKTSDPGPAPLVGQFLDGPVQGLGYRTESQRGFTDADGRFNYRPGEKVVFFIGGMELPAVDAAAKVTPLDVAGTGNVSDPKVVNLLVLLQSLDEDGDASNGIKIPGAAAAAVTPTAGRALALAMLAESAAAFRATLSGSTLLAGKPLVAQNAAIVHFVKTLRQEAPAREFTTTDVIVLQASVVKDDGSATAPGVELPARIRFVGLNLDTPGLVPEVSGVCAALTPLGQATSTRLEYTCTPSRVGSLEVTLKRETESVGSFSGTVEEPRVLLATSLGSLTLELDFTRAPITTLNFLSYVGAGYYDNTVFHRVISNFMVQGGGCIVGETEVLNGGCAAIASTLRLKGNTFPAIELERTDATGLSNVTGTVAMARTNLAKSATSQFFINVVDNEFLNATPNTTTPDKAGYAVFGRVVQGADTTLQAIRSVQVKSNGSELSPSLPLTPPVILSATRVR
jgi:peptidyl-prolyl cis-trans isomerase A (cyclophilin A)